MPIYWKFRSEKDQFCQIPCDDPTMSVAEVKHEIFVIKKWVNLKKRSFDLKLLDAETKKEYGPDDLIRKNSSVILMRVPLLHEPKNHRELQTLVSMPSEISSKEPSNLVDMQCSEEEKIKLMMVQSTYAYAPLNYLKVRNNQSGKVPATNVCKRCHKKGHWFQDCTFTINGKPASIRKATGIPRTMVKVVEGPEVPGAMITVTGEYVVYAPELVPVIERGTPKLPLPVRDLELLRESSEKKEESKDASLSPPSGGEDTDTDGFSPSSEPSDLTVWTGYSDDSYQQSSEMQYSHQDGSSYQQSTGYDQSGHSYQYQGYEDSQAGYSQWPHQQYYDHTYYGYDQASGYGTQPEAIQESTTYSQFSESRNGDVSGRSRHYSSRRSERRMVDSENRYWDSRQRENRPTKRRHRY